ncbi:MAG: PadR family transcriptional regulator [Verrucomicrobiales bacterium]|jgi:PadR family transcriptional regulator, regulatory protein PadR|nr:PadR family transcriptional regulator [Verrucomicrobiales bacterium]
MASFYDNWTIQVRKGILELCILNALEEGECYGYALVKQLAAIPGLHVAEGTIYPLLSRLKLHGLVATRLEESPDGPARKYYKLTQTGNKERGRMNTYYRGLSDAVNTLLTPVS